MSVDPENRNVLHTKMRKDTFVHWLIFSQIYKADSGGSWTFSFPTLQFLIFNISTVTSAIKRIFRIWVSEVLKQLLLEKKF